MFLPQKVPESHVGGWIFVHLALTKSMTPGAVCIKAKKHGAKCQRAQPFKVERPRHGKKWFTISEVKN